MLAESVIDKYRLHALSARFYENSNGDRRLKAELGQADRNAIPSELNLVNRICIVYSGVGMDRHVISEQWITNGTENKDHNYLSRGGRIQTGAKGIGRFALDRLGKQTKLWTRPKSKKETPTFWRMDWKQFETADLKLSDVKATVTDANDFDLSRNVTDNFSGFSFFSKLPANAFENDTFIQIEELRDDWSLKEVEDVFRRLEALIPPKDLKIEFRVFQGYQQANKLFGEVDTVYFNDYDYRMVAQYHAEDLRVDFQMARNEIDLKVLGEKYPKVFADAKPPFGVTTLKQKTFDFSLPIQQVIKWKKNEAAPVFFSSGSVPFYHQSLYLVAIRLLLVLVYFLLFGLLRRY